MVKFVEQSDAKALSDLRSAGLQKYYTFVEYFCTERALDDLEAGRNDWSTT